MVFGQWLDSSALLIHSWIKNYKHCASASRLGYWPTTSVASCAGNFIGLVLCQTIPLQVENLLDWKSPDSCARSLLMFGITGAFLL